MAGELLRSCSLFVLVFLLADSRREHFQLLLPSRLQATSLSLGLLAFLSDLSEIRKELSQSPPIRIPFVPPSTVCFKCSCLTSPVR